MLTSFSQGIRFCCTRLAMALCGLGICCPCLAELWSDETDAFRPNQRYEILPVSMMDDESLLASAAVRRNQRMCDSHRLLNNYWLAQNERNTWSGGSAVGRILKLGFRDFWYSHYQSGSQLSYSPQEEEDELSYWGKYAVDLSGDRLLVGVRFHF